MGFFLYSFSCISTFLMDILPQIATSASLTSHFVPHETHTHSHSFYNCIHKVLTHKQLILTIYLLIFLSRSLTFHFLWSFPFLILMAFNVFGSVLCAAYGVPKPTIHSSNFCSALCGPMCSKHLRAHTIIIILNGKQFTQ